MATVDELYEKMSSGGGITGEDLLDPNFARALAKFQEGGNRTLLLLDNFSEIRHVDVSELDPEDDLDLGVLTSLLLRRRP